MNQTDKVSALMALIFWSGRQIKHRKKFSFKNSCKIFEYLEHTRHCFQQLEQCKQNQQRACGASSLADGAVRMTRAGRPHPSDMVVTASPFEETQKRRRSQLLEEMGGTVRAEGLTSVRPCVFKERRTNRSGCREVSGERQPVAGTCQPWEGICIL